MYLNRTDYEKYFDAYEALAKGIANLMIQEKRGNISSNDAELDSAWENILKIDTKIAKVCASLFIKSTVFCLIII